MSGDWRVKSEEGWLLYIKVTPNASQTKIVGEVADAEGKIWLSVRISAPPESGKANKAVFKLLSKELGVSLRELSLKSGETARWKVFVLK